MDKKGKRKGKGEGWNKGNVRGRVKGEGWYKGNVR